MLNCSNCNSWFKINRYVLDSVIVSALPHNIMPLKSIYYFFCYLEVAFLISETAVKHRRFSSRPAFAIKFILLSGVDLLRV